MCQMCDDEPAVYKGLCATCLLDDGEEDEFGAKQVKPTYRHKNEEEFDR